jgi:hypothetical protein
MGIFTTVVCAVITLVLIMNGSDNLLVAIWSFNTGMSVRSLLIKGE